MKKTLITLTALSSVAMADYGYDYMYGGNFTGGGANVNPTFSQISDDCPFSLTLNSVEGKAYTDSTILSDDEAAALTTTTISNKVCYAVPEALAPNTNVSHGGSWTASFTLKNTSGESLSLHSIDFSVFVFNGGGNKQNADTFPRPITFTLASDAVNGTVTHLFKTQVASEGDFWKTDISYLLDTPLVLGAEDTFDFTLSVNRGDMVEGQTQYYGSFVGMSGMTVYIPEPATATLSLLALAGLAARRRRK